MAFWLNTFYIVVLSWAMYYVYSALAYDDVPWRTCENPWNSLVCRSEYELAKEYRTCAATAIDAEKECYVNTTGLQSPVNEFWERQVLQVTDGLHNPGEIRWPLALTLFLAWLACYFCIWKGVKWTGKVSNPSGPTRPQFDLNLTWLPYGASHRFDKALLLLPF